MGSQIKVDVLHAFRGRMRYRMEPGEMFPWPPPPEDLVGLMTCQPHWADARSCEESECECGQQLTAVAMRGPGTYRVFAVCPRCNKAVEL